MNLLEGVDRRSRGRVDDRDVVGARGEHLEIAAEVDAALLGDAVPVAAYGDPGFVEFLKAARD